MEHLYISNYSTTNRNSINLLMEEVRRLKFELAENKKKSSNLNDQLRCLISLMKRAWAGDKAAKTHIANIIGLEDMRDGGNDAENRELHQNHENGEAHHSTSPEPTDNPLDHLAEELLAVYNRMGAEELQQQQSYYLEQRRLYLDEILSNHHSRMSKGRPPDETRHDEVLDYLDRVFIKSRRVSSAKPLGGQRPQPISQQQRPKSCTVRYVTPAAPQLNDTCQCPDRKASAIQQSSDINLPYDDPRRYAQVGLFDSKRVVKTRTRPASASQLCHRDIQKNRHNSGSSLLSETADEDKGRSLKYEVVMPVTKMTQKSIFSKSSAIAFGSGVTSDADSAAKGKRVKSASNISLRSRPKSASSRLMTPTSSARLTTPTGLSSNRSPDHRFRPDRTFQLVDSAEELEEDFKRLNQMEERFRQTTINLQKKIGLNESGIIDPDIGQMN